MKTPAVDTPAPAPDTDWTDVDPAGAQSAPAAPPTAQESPPVKRGPGRPKGSKNKGAAPPANPDAPPAAKVDKDPGPPAAKPPKDPAKETPRQRAERWALKRAQMAEIAPIHARLHQLVSVPLAVKALAMRGIDLDRMQITGVVTGPGGVIQPAKMSGREALCQSLSEISALYMPVDIFDHPAAPALLTAASLAMAVAAAKVAEVTGEDDGRPIEVDLVSAAEKASERAS